MRWCAFVFGLLLSGARSAGVIPSGSTVFMSIPTAWQHNLRVEMRIRDVPIEVAAIPEQAEYEIVASYLPDSDGVGGTGVMEVVSLRDGRILYSARAGSRLGDATEKLATMLKKAILKP